MKTELIKEFEEKYQRSRFLFLQDTGIGDMHSEQGCYCDEYVEFLEQKLANGAEQSDSNCNIPHVSPRYYYVATKVNKNEIRLISGGFSKKDAIEYKQFIIQKYPTAFIIADFNEG